jgi:hypothetical protein
MKRGKPVPVTADNLLMPALVADFIRDHVLPPGIADQIHLRFCWCEVTLCGACEHGDHPKCLSLLPGRERWHDGGGAGFFIGKDGFGRPGYPEVHYADRLCWWTCTCEPCRALLAARRPVKQLAIF